MPEMLMVDVMDWMADIIIFCGVILFLAIVIALTAQR